MIRKFYDFIVDGNGGSPPYVPYQVCPKCNGQGIVSKPPWIAGDVDNWSSASASHICDVCNGQKIIPMFLPTPPKPKGGEE